MIFQRLRDETNLIMEKIFLCICITRCATLPPPFSPISHFWQNCVERWRGNFRLMRTRISNYKLGWVEWQWKQNTSFWNVLHLKMCWLVKKNDLQNFIPQSWKCNEKSCFWPSHTLAAFDDDPLKLIRHYSRN